MKENTKRFWQFRSRRKCSAWIMLVASITILYLPISPFLTLWRIGNNNKNNVIQMDQYSVISAPLPGPPLDICSDAAKYIPDQVSNHWKYIDQEVENHYPKVKVSGGIFLYPRQTSILSYLIRQIQIGLNRKMTICETGFGSGHSLALFIEVVAQSWTNNNDSGSVTHRTNQLVHIVSFDKFDRPYQVPLWRHFNDTIGATHTHGLTLEYVAGDSCKTVPTYLSDAATSSAKERKQVGAENFHCDILHGSSLCPTDNIDLVEHSPCGVLLTSTAMSDLSDRQVYFGPNAQWRKLRDRQCITDVVCFHEDKQDIRRDLVFAKKGSTHSGKFCIAMTTGKCQKSIYGSNKDVNQAMCNTDIHSVVASLQLEKVCCQDQILAPV